MAVTNILQAVQTYNKSGLAILQNLYPFISKANTKFKGSPTNMGANLGDTFLYDQPVRGTVTDSLVALPQSITQRTRSLSVVQQLSSSYVTTSQELIFNLNKPGWDYLEDTDRSYIAGLGSRVEKILALNAVSGVVNPLTNLVDSASGPYAFYGDGRTNISTYLDMANVQSNMMDFGLAPGPLEFFIPPSAKNNIANTGFNQFTLERNDKAAQSWEVGSFGTPICNFNVSNLLPVHFAGNVGQNQTPGANILTVVSTNDNNGQNITQITFSGGGTSDPDAIKYADLLQSVDGVSGFPIDLRFQNHLDGTVTTGLPVQIMSIADSGSNGSGNVTINIKPGLTISQSTDDRISINQNIVAGMQFKVMDSHRAGLVVSDRALYFACPPLPDTEPFPSYTSTDALSKVSLQSYYGFILGQNSRMMVHNLIIGTSSAQDYLRRLLFPL